MSKRLGVLMYQLYLADMDIKICNEVNGCDGCSKEECCELPEKASRAKEDFLRKINDELILLNLMEGKGDEHEV